MATGVNNTTDQANNTAPASGAVYVFTRSGTTWSQQAYVKSSNTGTGDYFGYAVALSANGNTLAVGAWGEDSAATGVNDMATGQANNAVAFSGAAYLFIRSNNGTWSQQAYVKASNTGANDRFGRSLALSGDGNTLAVGAYAEDSAATGVDGDQADMCMAVPVTNCAAGSGAAYVFIRRGTTWSQQAYVKASNTGAGDAFGGSVALSGDGLTLAVGAYRENGSKTGAIYLLTSSGTTWSQQAYVIASNSGTGDWFGVSLALSTDGNTLAVGAYLEDSAAAGVTPGAPSETAVPDGANTNDSGAVYLFTRNGATWTQQAYVKASNTGGSDLFGYSVALSGDGGTLAVGAYDESSNSTGVNSTPNESAPSAGAVYLY